MLIVSTQGLLNNLVNQANKARNSYIAIATTKKLYLVSLIFQHLQQQPQIAVVAYIIHSSEDEEAYSYGLSTIKSFLKVHQSFHWELKVIFLLF